MLLKVIIINWIAYEINLFLPIPEAGKSKRRVPADLESSEGVLLASETASFLLYPHRTERVKGAHLDSYLEGTNPILEGFDLRIESTPRRPTFIYNQTRD